MTFKYGAMSSVYSLEAENKLTAYAAMVLQYNRIAFAIALYEPEEIVKNDSWLFVESLSKRLDEIFGGEGSFDKYLKEHVEEIRNAYKSIKQEL